MPGKAEIALCDAKTRHHTEFLGLAKKAIGSTGGFKEQLIRALEYIVYLQLLNVKQHDKFGVHSKVK